MAPRLGFAACVLAACAALVSACPGEGGIRIFATPGHVAKPGQLKDLQPSVDLLLANIPNSTYIRVPFNKMGGPTQEINPGQMNLEKLIKKFVGNCPNTPIVLLGYSEGACITMDTLCGASSAEFPSTTPINSTLTKNLIATVVFGDETRAAAQPYNRGTCQGVGELTRLNPDGCDPYATRIRSFCDTPDPYCCVGGNNATVHGEYAGEYDNAMLAFVKAQLTAFHTDNSRPIPYNA